MQIFSIFSVCYAESIVSKISKTLLSKKNWLKNKKISFKMIHDIIYGEDNKLSKFKKIIE